LDTMANFYNVGHRGASAYQHENTVLSLEEAISRRADMIEFDVRQTIDGVMVLFHDWGVKTSKGQRKLISNITYDELCQTAHNQGYEIATFEDVLKQFGRRIPMNIEIKVGGFESDIISLLQTYPPACEPTLSSFFPWVVIRLKRINDNLKTALILGQERVHKFNILARPVVRKLVWTMGIGAIHLQETIISRAVVESLVRGGVSVLVWTVDDPEEMRRFLKMGVDGIITNKPDLLYEVCLELANAKEPILKKITNNFGRFAYAV
jgi:glycerophosphoryl diester phosphodiesterase